MFNTTLEFLLVSYGYALIYLGIGIIFCKLLALSPRNASIGMSLSLLIHGQSKKFQFSWGPFPFLGVSVGMPTEDTPELKAKRKYLPLLFQLVPVLVLTTILLINPKLTELFINTLKSAFFMGDLSVLWTSLLNSFESTSHLAVFCILMINAIPVPFFLLHHFTYNEEKSTMGPLFFSYLAVIMLCVIVLPIRILLLPAFENTLLTISTLLGYELVVGLLAWGILKALRFDTTVSIGSPAQPDDTRRPSSDEN